MTKLNTRLAYLYNKYTTGSCTEDERTEFMTLVRGDENIEELKTLIEVSATDPPLSTGVISDAKADLLYNLIMEKGKRQALAVGQIRRIFSFRNVAVAASMICLLGIGTYFLLLKKDGNELVNKNRINQQPSKSDANPGGNKAILTLADGSTIVLDSATNGLLSQQGETKIVKLDDGALSYKGNTANGGEVLYNTIATPRGGLYQISLSDGSKVWLNAASSLKFPATFSGKERKVELAGEGYFEVAKNDKVPFKVAVGGLEILVLGTHFNVMSYAEEKIMRTTLLEGSVRLNTAGNVAYLTPGQQARLNINNPAINIIDGVDVEEELAWKNGYFDFKDASLETIMNQLSRWYDVDVSYKGSIPTDHFKGKISRNSNLSTVLKILTYSGIRVKIDNKKITVMP